MVLCNDPLLFMFCQGICGVEPGPGYDGVAYSLSILCLGYSVSLGFHSREALAAWDARLRYSLGEGQCLRVPTVMTFLEIF